MLEKAFGVKFTYVPFKGGGEVAVELVGKHVKSTVNNPVEAVGHWRSRQAPLALCVFRGGAHAADQGEGDGQRSPGATSPPARRPASTSGAI